ncbi:TPR-like protein [Rickenella mellea]|uniref:TPR-like protein n=1 Tax=Rickenella mellea TaxID=50990 RepID=A0A4Y7PJB2_9AGAM|nr:TPR-like protein [Rickenella mellea]
MSKSFKAQLDTWTDALRAYDRQDLDTAIDLFSSIGDSSKILTNIGLIFASVGEHEAAIEYFKAATQLDQYLAIAYFQCGVSNFLLGRFEIAIGDFDETLRCMRGNQFIDYTQLGLKFKLFSVEVLFNKGLCQIRQGKLRDGIKVMQRARGMKMTEEHDVIEDAMAYRGRGYCVFSITAGVLYRPSDNVLKNSMKRNYMEDAVLVAVADEKDAYTTFTGATRLQQGLPAVDGKGKHRPLVRTTTAPSRPADTEKVVEFVAEEWNRGICFVPLVSRLHVTESVAEGVPDA